MPRHHVYSYSQACEALNVGDTALRRWVAQWREQQAKPPRTAMEVGTDARRIRELEASRAACAEVSKRLRALEAGMFAKGWMMGAG